MTDTLTHASRPVTRADVEQLLLLDALDAAAGDPARLAPHLGLSPALTPALLRAAVSLIRLGLAEEADGRVRLTDAGQVRLKRWRAAVG